ncbi:MAG: tetratricopeptide repeat protein, partial [Deltaproteobacteria bacterium]|nr:tetratricopeptide repeat protein [Deltaproteobacteria bacterium]
KSFSFTLRREGMICLLIAAAILAVYWQVGDHAFISFDDRMYVTENPHVRAGLTLEGIRWAFVATDAHNWHPVTWLSHMVDYQMYGLHPKGHHLTNVIFHMLNSILLFLVFTRMTGAVWKSAFVAALFAIHPIHVESVAWVAERKDVLSAFFWMLTMGSYAWYVERPAAGRYALVLLFFALGLMAKPMLVTAPFVLLLLDYWPLGRLRNISQDSDEKHPGGTESENRKTRKQPAKHAAPSSTITGLVHQWKLILPFLREKIPLFVLAAASGVITVHAQHNVMKSFELYPFGTRLANALVSYASYMGKMVVPTHLAIFYPHPEGTLAIWQIGGAAVLLLGATTAVWMLRRSYLAVGWLWYLGTLVPVIGLVQVGLQSMADRYTYIPLIGLFVIVAWGIPELAAKWRYRSTALAVSAGVLVSVLMMMTFAQVKTWENDITLFQHATGVTEDNWWAHYNLGLALAQKGDSDTAVRHFEESLRIEPRRPDTLMNIGVIHAKRGDIEAAADYFSRALEIQPDNLRAHLNAGLALLQGGKTDKAVSHFRVCLRIAPDHPEAHYHLGLALAESGDTDGAIKYFSNTIRLTAGHARAHNSLGIALSRKGRVADAAAHFREAVKINPDFAEARTNLERAEVVLHETDRIIEKLRMLLAAHPGDHTLHYDLGIAYYRRGEFDEAVHYYLKALSINPDAVQVLNNLAVVYMIQEKYAEAISVFNRMAEIQPDNSRNYYNIACLHARQGREEEALSFLEKAVEKGYDNWELIRTDRDLDGIRHLPGYRRLVEGHR